MKIVICGPPHSGKSVFVANLKELLPRNSYFLFRCAPDGEGTWSQRGDQELVARIRRKGRFDARFMEYVLNGLRNCRGIPIVLVDVGGIRSAENEAIFRLCDAFIVISSSDEEMVKWREFGESLGLRCLAVLKSVLHGEEVIESTDLPVRGVITNLERGTYQLESPLLNVIASQLIEQIQKEEEKMTGKLDINTLVGADHPRTPNGNIYWQPDRLSEYIAALPQGQQEVHFDGAGPTWLYGALVHAVHPAWAYLNDPRIGEIRIPAIRPRVGGDPVLDWKVEDCGEYTFVEYTIREGIIDVDELESIVPPEVDFRKGVVVSGKGPIWLSATIIMAYHVTPWVASFAPQLGGAVVVMRHYKKAPALGVVIPIR
jgi:CRISPR-associated protein Csx3